MGTRTEAMVTRQVELTEEQNETLEQRAASAGRSVSDLIRRGVDVVLRMGDGILLGEAKSPPRLSERESELLLAINRGLPAEVAKRYRILVDRRRSGTLSPEEHQELLRLTDQAEQLQAERIEHLAELSQLRGKPLGALMEELGIRPSPNG
jgi:hypothetical protein